MGESAYLSSPKQQCENNEKKAIKVEAMLLIIIIKDIYLAQVRKGHKCAMSAE